MIVNGPLGHSNAQPFQVKTRNMTLLLEEKKKTILRCPTQKNVRNKFNLRIFWYLQRWFGTWSWNFSDFMEILFEFSFHETTKSWTNKRNESWQKLHFSVYPAILVYQQSWRWSFLAHLAICSHSGDMGSYEYNFLIILTETKSSKWKYTLPPIQTGVNLYLKAMWKNLSLKRQHEGHYYVWFTFSSSY